MPQLGETVTEGTVLSWLVKAGDVVSEDDPILEISTDKVDTEVPSPFSGTVTALLVEEGETVAVGANLLELDGDSQEEPGDRWRARHTIPAHDAPRHWCAPREQG